MNPFIACSHRNAPLSGFAPSLESCRTHAESVRETDRHGSVQSNLDYNRILVPLSLSASSRAALSFAQSLARETGAQLLLLHAIDLNIAGEERGIPRTRLVNQRRRDVELELGRIAHALGPNLDCEVLVETGKPAEVILQTARQRGADAIVMGTHGLRGWMKWLHRNTAKAVARSAPCALWLISAGPTENALNLVVVENTAGVGAS